MNRATDVWNKIVKEKGDHLELSGDFFRLLPEMIDELWIKGYEKGCNDATAAAIKILEKGMEKHKIG